jgi:hypothetical protein
VDGAHKREVTRSQLADQAFFDQAAEGLEGKDGVQVGALFGTVVGVGPGEVFCVWWDLAVREVAREIVYVEAPLFGQMDTTRRDEGEAGSVEGLLRPDERWHTA